MKSGFSFGLTMLAGLLLLTTFFFAVAMHEDALAEPASLIECVKAQARQNFASFSDYSCDLESKRLVWKLDGTLEKDNFLIKKVYAKQPDKRKEVFVSGTMFGKPVKKNSFIYERLGLDQKSQYIGVEIFREGFEGKFKTLDKGVETEKEISYRVIGFETLNSKATQLQTGRMLISEGGCHIDRIVGRMADDSIVGRNEMDVTIRFDNFGGIRVIREMTLEGELKFFWKKNKTKTTNIYSNYKFDNGLADSFFEG